MRVRSGFILLALCALVAPARANDKAKARSIPQLVAALQKVEPAEAKALVQALRERGPKVARAVRAALAGSKGRARARLARLLQQLEGDWHRAKCPEGMVYVPSGPVEKPRSRAPWGPSGERVEVAAFYIGRTEVTVGAWRTWIAKLEEAEPGCARRQGLRIPPRHVAEGLPVTRVPWGDAQRYAREAGGRLPTAAEFERALRGSSVATYPWGNEMREGFANLRDTGPGRVQPVGSHPKGASPFGVLDLVGNVAEWTSTEVAQGRSGRFPLVVGGSYADRADPGLLWRGRPRMRARTGPDETLPTVGFRVVQDPPKLP